MTFHALYHGGSRNPVYPSIVEDIEVFHSLRSAKQEFERRSDGISADLFPPFMNLYDIDPNTVPDPCPSRILERGPRGGVREVVAR